MMSARFARLAALVLFLLLLPLSGVLAKGPFARITVDGPGLTGPVDITDADVLSMLGMAEMMDLFVTIDAPVEAGPGFELQRFFHDDRQNVDVQFDTVHYYPHASDGLAYVHYIGIQNGSSEYDGRWFAVTHEGDSAMRSVLSDAGVDVPGQPVPWTLEAIFRQVDRLFTPA